MVRSISYGKCTCMYIQPTTQSTRQVDEAPSSVLLSPRTTANISRQSKFLLTNVLPFILQRVSINDVFPTLANQFTFGKKVWCQRQMANRNSSYSSFLFLHQFAKASCEHILGQYVDKRKGRSHAQKEWVCLPSPSLPTPHYC